MLMAWAFKCIRLQLDYVSNGAAILRREVFLRCLMCNSYHCKKWIRLPGIKFWTMVFELDTAIEKGLNPTIPLLDMSKYEGRQGTLTLVW